MKKVIEGKVYNTETATKIASESYSTPGDFNYVHEELYVTKKGNYFLFGKGGAASIYARDLGNNSYGGGSGIIPMSRKRAFSWCQKNDCVEAIEQYFADMVEEA